MKISGDEPAMPIQYEEEYGDNGRKIWRIYEGLTIRHHFAAMAMQGILSSAVSNLPDEDYAAIQSVKYADYLIKELNKTVT